MQYRDQNIDSQIPYASTYVKSWMTLATICSAKWRPRSHKKASDDRGHTAQKQRGSEKVLPTELQYRGKRAIDYPAQGNPNNTLPPSERRGLWDVTILYTVVGRPTRFVLIPGEPERQAFGGRVHKRFYKRNDRSEIRTLVLHDVKCEGASY